MRTLQKFVPDHVWDQFRMRDLLQQRLLGLAPHNMADELLSIGVIDEMSVADKQTKTSDLLRQYCGAGGEIENCTFTVPLKIVRGHFKMLVDGDK